MDETCNWYRIKDLIWQTGCDHQIGTPITWEPVEGMACMCCHKPVEVTHDARGARKEEDKKDT